MKKSETCTGRATSGYYVFSLKSALIDKYTHRSMEKNYYYKNVICIEKIKSLVGNWKI